MTNLRDILNDFAEEIIETTLTAISLERKDNTAEINQVIDEEKERLKDEYIDIIKERLIG